MATDPMIATLLTLLTLGAVAACAAATTPGCGVFSPDFNLMGSDYSVTPHNDSGCVGDGHCPCQQACDADPKCKASVLSP